MGQLSFFSAEARAPAYDDLEGLLAGPGQVVSRAGAARISVVVVEGWRVDALVAELARLGVTAECAPGEQPGGVTVRTPFLTELAAVAAGWAQGSVKRPPRGLVLDGPRLRWWCLAAGCGHPLGYTLGLGPNDELAWPAVGAALAAAGVAGVFVGPRGDGPAYRVVGRRRLARLHELVGPVPEGVPGNDWPAA